MNNLESITFKRNKVKDTLFFLLSSGFTAMGVSLIEENSFKAWLGIVFFGGMTLLFFIVLVTNICYLKLDKEGFEQRLLFKTTKFKWSDVSKFEITSFRGNKRIHFKCRNQFGNHNWKSITSSHTINTQDLLDLMKKYKRKNRK